MSEGDRALDLWLAEHVKGMKLRDTGENSCELWSDQKQCWIACTQQGTHYTEDDYPQLAEALRRKPHRYFVAVEYWPIGDDGEEVCRAFVTPDPLPLGQWPQPHVADTPGLALGRAAEQALGGAE